MKLQDFLISIKKIEKNVKNKKLSTKPPASVILTIKCENCGICKASEQFAYIRLGKKFLNLPSLYKIRRGIEYGDGFNLRKP